ncbi:KilA-N domain-containing protein [Ferruginibacter sp.]
MAKNKKIEVQGKEITIITENGGEYISLTDMLKAKDGDFFISDWLRNRNTVEYLGIWEAVYNPAFNYGEFAIIKSQVGLNSYKLSVKEWVEKTNAIGLKATTGRYGTFLQNSKDLNIFGKRVKELTGLNLKMQRI